jgi:serine/threonine-protein kinase
MNATREQLGQYQILGPLGAGGMGEVYIARDPSLGRKVAIKLLPVRLSEDRETLVRFTREARSASALNHPNIVTIHEVGMDKSSGSPYIVMEYIEGRDLRSLLADGPLSNRRTLDIAAQIADGLAAAHEQGIIHRDLKPENVMVTKDGYVKILDFGLAKVVGAAEEEQETARLDFPGTNPGTILGTIGYMSPEQATGKGLDFRSDQFALGSILYELSTGKPAFEAENAIDTLSAILHRNIPSIARLNAQAPPQFCAIIDRLLSKQPNDRYASTRDLARDLRSIRDRFFTVTQSEERPRPPKVSRRTMIIAGVVAAVLLVAGAAIIWLQRHSTSTAAAAAAEPATASKKYLAVMRFKDLTGVPGIPNGQLVVDGLAETLSARLSHFSTVQVMRAATPPDAATDNDPQKVARELGANVVLTGSMQRNGDRLRVAYEIIDLAHGASRTGDLVEGSVSDLFTIQDRLAESIAASLQLGAPAFRPTSHDTAISQTRYLEALGHLRRYDDESSVDSAIQILEELSAQSGSASVQAALGRAYLAKYQLTHDAKWATPAAAACEKALSSDPQNPDVHVTLGELRRLTGRLTEAIKEYEAALAQQPTNADAILGLAEAYEAFGNLADAEAAYKKSIGLQPNYWGGYNKLGGFYADHKRLAEGILMYQKAIDLSPESVMSYTNLGAIYVRSGRLEEAVQVFSNSIAKKPTGSAYSNLGICYYTLGRYADAAKAFERAAALVPKRQVFWLNLGDANRWVPGAEAKAAAAYDEAIRLAKTDLQLNPADGVTRARLAACLAKRGDLRSATHEISRAVSDDPRDANAMYYAGVVANVTGAKPAAVKYLKRAVDLGYSRSDIERDPEFSILRESAEYKTIFATRVQ